MLAEWYIKKQLDTLELRTGVRLPDWHAVKRLAGLKQLIVPTTHLFYAGQPVIRQFFAVEDQTLATKHRVLQVAASLAKAVQKSYFRPVVQAADDAELALREMEGDMLGDRGVTGKLDRTWFILGDGGCMEQEGIELGVTIQTLAQQFELDGKYTLFLAQKQPKRLLGIFACEYELDADAPHAIQALRAMGIELVLLTGVKTSIAKGLGLKLSLSLIHSELTSVEKERVLTSLIAQQPETLVLGPKGGKRAERILIGKGEAGTGVVLTVPELMNLATIIAETRRLVTEARKSVLWRKL